MLPHDKSVFFLIFRTVSVVVSIRTFRNTIHFIPCLSILWWWRVSIHFWFLQLEDLLLPFIIFDPWLSPSQSPSPTNFICFKVDRSSLCKIVRYLEIPLMSIVEWYIKIYRSFSFKLRRIVFIYYLQVPPFKRLIWLNYNVIKFFYFYTYEKLHKDVSLTVRLKY